MLAERSIRILDELELVTMAGHIDVLWTEFHKLSDCGQQFLAAHSILRRYYLQRWERLLARFQYVDDFHIVICLILICQQVAQQGFCLFIAHSSCLYVFVVLSLADLSYFGISG